MHVFYSIFSKSNDAKEPFGLRELNATFDTPSDNDIAYKDVAVDVEDEKPRASIEESYGDMDIGNRIIVRDEENRRFYVFDDIRELYEMLTRPPLKCLHEVMLAGHRQKLRFDFDFNKTAFDALVAGVRSADASLMSDLLQAPEKFLSNPMLSQQVRDDYARNLSGDALKGGYGQFAYRNQQMLVGDLMIRDFIRFLSGELRAYILRCDSYTVESSKFSVHLIVGAFTRNYEEMAEYAHHLYTKYRQQSSFAVLCARFLDMAVYKSIQNFRLCLAVKFGAGHERRKVLRNSIVDGDLADFESWRHTLLTNISRYDVDLTDEVKRRVVITKARTEADMRGSTYFDINKAPDGFAEIIAPYSIGFQPYAIYGNLVLFKRTERSHCKICGREHGDDRDKGDNSLMVIILSRAYVIKCRRDMAGRKIVIPVASRMASRIQNPDQAPKESIAGAPLTTVASTSLVTASLAMSSPGKKQATLRKARVDNRGEEPTF